MKTSRVEGSPDRTTTARHPLRLLVLDAGAIVRLRSTLVVIWILLALIGGISVLLIHAVENVTAQEVGQFLSLGREQTPGTWVAALLLLTCALLAVVGALEAQSSEPRWTRAWWILAIVFAFLSFDEVADAHGQASPPISRVLGDTSGVLTFAWIIPAVILGIGFVIIEWPLLRHLGAAGRNLVIAGVIFVAGAVGLEMVEGELTSDGARESLTYDLLVIAEELLEFGAVMWAIVILAQYLRGRLDDPELLAVPGPSRRAGVIDSDGGGALP